MFDRRLALLASLALASCAVGTGGTIGLHYTTDHSIRVQLEVPLELALVGAGTSAEEANKPYVRAAVIPALGYDINAGKLDGGVRGALGPVFERGGTWLAPAFTIGASGFGDKASLDVGLTADLEIPFSRGASCDELVFTNLLVPQVSVVRRVYDVDHPLSRAGGDWDIGIAAGVRHTRFLTCR